MRLKMPVAKLKKGEKYIGFKPKKKASPKKKTTKRKARK